MSDPFTERPVSGKALLSVAALVSFALLATVGSRLTDVGTTSMPETVSVQTRDLHFKDRADGSIVVTSSLTAEQVYVLDPGGGGFVRGVLRGLGRERKLRDIGPEDPYRLTHWRDGRLSLSDPSTGVTIDLGAFGPDNIAPFARMLDFEQVGQNYGPEVSLSH